MNVLNFDKRISSYKLLVGRAIFNLRWRFTCVLRDFFVFFFCINTRRPRKILINYNCEIRNDKLVEDFGNFSMLIQLQRLLTLQGHSCEIRIANQYSEKEQSNVDRYTSDLQELASRYCLPVREFCNDSGRLVQISKQLFRKFDFYVQFEHFVPSLLYWKARSLDEKLLRSVPISFFANLRASDVHERKIIAWGFRFNSDFPHRNSKETDFVDYLHALIGHFLLIEIIFLGSLEARRRIADLISSHKRAKCQCTSLFTFRFQTEDGFIGALRELEGISSFFTDTGHGICDFVLGTDIPYHLVFRFSRYHPNQIEFGFPWINNSQHIFHSKEDFILSLSNLEGKINS